MNEEEAIERVERYIKSFNGNALDCIAIGTVLTLLEKQNELIHKMIDYIFDEDTSNFICKEMEKECDNNCSECYLKYFQEGLNNE